MAFTPGAAETLAAARELIADSWSAGNSKANAVSGTVSGLKADLPTLSAFIDLAAGSAASPAVVEPGVTIPASIDVTDITNTFKTQYLDLVALLATKFTDFETTYFPDDSATYSAVTTWVDDALAGGGLPTAVAAQLYTDEVDKSTAEAARAADSVIQTFAARRFPLPPDAAAAAVLQIHQKAQDVAAEAGRKITAMSVEMIKFAVEKAISMRQLALSSAIDYIKALASGPDMATRVVGIGYDAQSKLISAASQFYGARTEVAKLATQNNQFNVSTALQAGEKNQLKDLSILDSRVKAVLAEAQALASMASALYNNVHASAGTQYNVSVNENSTV